MGISIPIILYIILSCNCCSCMLCCVDSITGEPGNGPVRAGEGHGPGAEGGGQDEGPPQPRGTAGNINTHRLPHKLRRQTQQGV